MVVAGDLPSRIVIDAKYNELIVRNPARRETFLLIFGGVLFAGSALTVIGLLLHEGADYLPRMFIALLISFAGYLLFRVLCWMAGGLETLTVRDGLCTYVYSAPPFGSETTEKLAALRKIDLASKFYPDLNSDKGEGGWEFSGRVILHFEGTKIVFGSELDRQEAEAVADAVRRIWTMSHNA